MFHLKKKKKISGNNIALFYISHIRNQNFIAAVLYSKVLAVNQGDAMAPWPIFQFGLNCLYSVWVFLASRIAWAYFP